MSLQPALTILLLEQQLQRQQHSRLLRQQATLQYLEILLLRVGQDLFRELRIIALQSVAMRQEISPSPLLTDQALFL
jgi:hypothetical protein